MSDIVNIITKNSKTIILYLFVVCVLLIYIANKNHSKKSNYNSYDSNEISVENAVTDNSIQDDDNTTQDDKIFSKTDDEISNETNNDSEEEERPETGNLDFNK